LDPGAIILIDAQEVSSMGKILQKPFVRLGVDVMITIFCDFGLFSAKNWSFSQKPIL
jgi:hypothetical protein